MYPHRIRLRGPWESQPLSSISSGRLVPAPCRVVMPGRWTDQGLSGFAGRVRYRRRFGYPGQIDPHERVWLTIDAFEGDAEIRVNDVILARVTGGAPFESDISTLLRQRNELQIVLEGGVDAGLWGEVALEVRCAAFLAKVSPYARRLGGAIVVGASGELIGEADGLLELYLLVNGRTVIYLPIEASGPQKLFTLGSALLPHEIAEGLDFTKPVAMQVDLVKGATVWYTFHGKVTLQDELH